LIFWSPTLGTPVLPPGISEILTGSGFYNFSIAVTTTIEFLAYSGGSLSATDSYIKGVLDPVLAVDQQIGQPTDSFGSTNIDPTTLFGHANRRQEFDEGAAVYNKSTTLWDVSSRGSSTLLMEKTLTNTSTLASKN
jgi:hypothetical protein